MLSIPAKQREDEASAERLGISPVLARGMELCAELGFPRHGTIFSRQHPVIAGDQVQNIHSINSPWSNALEAPERRYNDIVPGVVGSQFSVVGCPAARDNPSFGILKAFGPASCAETSASSDAAKGRITRRMAESVVARTWNLGVDKWET